jgi:hypothetical protein
MNMGSCTCAQACRGDQQCSTCVTPSNDDNDDDDEVEIVPTDGRKKANRGSSKGNAHSPSQKLDMI